MVNKKDYYIDRIEYLIRKYEKDEVDIKKEIIQDYKSLFSSNFDNFDKDF